MSLHTHLSRFDTLTQSEKDLIANLTLEGYSFADIAGAMTDTETLESKGIPQHTAENVFKYCVYVSKLLNKEEIQEEFTPKKEGRK